MHHKTGHYADLTE